jgi:hypothetical protein
MIGAVSWKALGIKAVGRTIHPASGPGRNYRNTREILRLAAHFTAKNVKNNEDSIPVVPVDPGQAILRAPGQRLRYFPSFRYTRCSLFHPPGYFPGVIPPGKIRKNWRKFLRFKREKPLPNSPVNRAARSFMRNIPYPGSF